MSDFTDSETRKAIKRHQCVWCKGWIEKGEYHHRQGGKWEGEWQDWRAHLDCLKAHHREDRENHGYGELCDEYHQRGRTCSETENERLRFEKEFAEWIAEDIKNGKSARDIADMAIAEVEEWMYAEERRVEAAREKAKSKEQDVPKDSTHAE